MMGEISQVIFDSFKLLYKRPVLFLPKLVSTFLSSLVFLLFVYRPEILLSVSKGLFLAGSILLVFLISLIGIIASLMVASMVKKEENKDLLKYSFSRSLKKLKVAAKVALVIMAFSFLTAVIFTLGYLSYIYSGTLTVLVFTAAILVALVAFVSYSSYFIPITLLESSSLWESVKESYSTSNENRNIVSVMVFFSFLLLGLAFVSTGYLEKIGMIGFLAGRLISTVVNTYLFTVSPELYLRLSS